METLNSKYKPYYLQDLYLEPNVKNILDTLISLDNINILIKGNADSGKTTLMGCIIRNYYNLSQCDSFSERNIMFINSLKEQGVNYYRNEMKTFCQSSCDIYGKKKMVVIDDMDILNEQSQQVFRNYIDKYKNNVNFICSCSSIEKIIESIQSRLHIFTINCNTDEDNSKILKNIITHEKLNLQPQVQNYLLQVSNHSIRNIINNLEKIYLLKCGVNDIEVCKKVCTNISYVHFDIYFENLKNKKLKDAIYLLYELHDYGYSVIDLLEFIYQYVKKTNQLEELDKYKIIPIICKYITIFSKIHEHNIELALFTNDIFVKLFYC
jgi:DNA polymerase III delta prime subunit